MIPPDANQMEAIHASLTHRRDEILTSICKLVEIEPPSGDLEGSRAVVDLLVEIARTIPAINAVERIPAPGLPGWGPRSASGSDLVGLR